jgi:5-methylcytosine-specific restriction endonuclease McrA
MKVINFNANDFKENYRHPLWQQKRLIILERDDWKCQRCGVDDVELHVHHDFYEPGLLPWEYEDVYLRTLCKHCHEDRHARAPHRRAA